MDVLAGPGHVVDRRGRRALTVDARSLASNRRRIQKPARHRSRSENENFAQTDATSEPGIPKPTSGHLRRRRRARCPEVGLGIPKPTSGHLKKNERSRCPEVGLGIPKPTSGHLKKKRTIKVSRGRFRNSRFHRPTLCRAHEKSMQNSLVFIVF